MSSTFPVRSAWLSTDGQTREDTRVTPLGTYTPTSAVAPGPASCPGQRTARTGGRRLRAGVPVRHGRDRRPGPGGPAGRRRPGRLPAGAVRRGRAEPSTRATVRPHDLVVIQVSDGRTTAAPLRGRRGRSSRAPGARPPRRSRTWRWRCTRDRAKDTSAGGSTINWGSDVTICRPRTVAVGGVMPVYGAGPAVHRRSYPGQYLDTGSGLARWDGNAWNAYPAVPTWQNWTPVWSDHHRCRRAGLRGPTVNAGTSRTARTAPDLDVTFGDTINWGSGANSKTNWTFSLPVPAASVTRRSASPN